MAKSKGSKNNSSDRDKWKKILNSMVLMLKIQQTQIGSLAKDRKLLEDRIKLQYDRWASDVNLFQDQISQMNRDFSVQEMEHLVEAAKADWLMGLKQREAFVYKKKFEDADDDLSDFRDCFDCLSNLCSAEQNVSTSSNGGELVRLKYENEKLRAEKGSEVSVLLSEKKFVWNQYNEMEKDLNKQLKAKKDEVKSLNDKIQILLSRLEESESSNTVKDAMIATLKTDMEKLESESGKKDEEILNLCKEAEILRRKSKNGSGTPLLKRCIKGGSVASSRLNRKTTGVGDGRTVTFKTESSSGSPSDGHEKGRRSSKRKAVDIVNISEETPKLFTSSFKVPKLKSSSPAPT